MSGRGRGRGRGQKDLPPKEPGQGFHSDQNHYSRENQDFQYGVSAPAPICETNKENQPYPVTQSLELPKGQASKGQGKSLTAQESPLSLSPDYSPERPSSPGGSDLSEESGYVSSPKNLSSTIAEMALLPLAKRPDYGTAGRPIVCISNHFLMNVRANRYFHYDVDFYSNGKKKIRSKFTRNEKILNKVSQMEYELEKNMSKGKCHSIFDKVKKLDVFAGGYPAFDGCKNIYTVRPLDIQDPYTCFVSVANENGKERKFKVIVQPVEKDDGTNIIHMNLNLFREASLEKQQEMMQVLHTIMNYRDSDADQVHIGRAFFLLSDKRTSLGEGMEIWFGYNQSVHLIEKGISLLVNLSAKAFHTEGPVIDYVSEILKRDIRQNTVMTPFDVKKVANALKGVRIVVTHMKYKRRYTVQGVTFNSAQNQTFSANNSNTVASYFAQTYGRLRYPDMHCLSMKSTNNTTYIPFEHCLVEAKQPIQGKLNAANTAKMIKHTAITPAERFRDIKRNAGIIQKTSAAQMREFQISFNMTPLTVPVRVLDAPVLGYTLQNSDKKLESRPDNRGVWRLEPKAMFTRTTEIDSWIALSFSRKVDEKKLREIANTMQSTAYRLGLKLKNLLGVRQCNPRESVENVLKKAKADGANFALIVLPRLDRKYDEIKFIADTQLNFVTQCLEEGVAYRLNDQIATNLCLKLNSKLGGVNHFLVEKPMALRKPIMIVGADAVHSARGSGCPSIASVVGSVDAYPSKYVVTCRVQENKDDSKCAQETILEMQQMMETLIQKFKEHTRGRIPEKIIFFRDGVSDGQFRNVMSYEVMKVQAALQNQLDILIPITYVVVQKRHQVRLQPQNPRDGVGRAGNIPPGSTVDKEITNPGLFDYFLNSHEGIQGTAKPARYTVLYDENNFNSDDLQRLSYDLCYMYEKCNRSISIPAPVRYADLACYRAKKYADMHLPGRDELSVASGCSDEASRLPPHVRHAIDNIDSIKTSMFFL